MTNNAAGLGVAADRRDQRRPKSSQDRGSTPVTPNRIECHYPLSIRLQDQAEQSTLRPKERGER